MGILALPRLDPARWLGFDRKSIDWSLYLNTLLWNLNYWDSVSTLAGEVDNPTRTLPRALFWAVVLVVLGYFVPLLVGIGAMEELHRNLWVDGYFAEVAKTLGGVWLRWWIEAASALSNMGMFEAEMSSDSFQLLGMAQRGVLPECFGIRSGYGTPSLGILFSASGVLLLSWLSFQETVAAENYLYCFGMFLEFAAFLWLRIKEPVMARPFRIPLGTVGVVLMCLPPSILLFLVLVVASMRVMLLSILAVLVGFLLYPCLGYVNKKNWMKFSTSPVLGDPDTQECAAAHEDSTAQEEVGLLAGHGK